VDDINLQQPAKCVIAEDSLLIGLCEFIFNLMD